MEGPRQQWAGHKGMPRKWREYEHQLQSAVPLTVGPTHREMGPGLASRHRPGSPWNLAGLEWQLPKPASHGPGL